MAGTVAPKQLDHVGIAVKDFDAMVKFMKETYGVEPRLAEQSHIGIRGAMFQFGQSKIEIVSPTKPDTAIAKFLDSRGPGLHHVAFRVDSVQKALDSLKAKGAELVDQAPRAGMFGTVGFAHPKSTQGILTEFVQDFLPEHQPKK